MPFVWVLASRRSYGHCAAPSCASARSSEITPSINTAAPNAHSKSPTALLTIRFALVGWSKIVTGTLLGAFTSSNRLVLQAATSAATITPLILRILIICVSPLVGRSRAQGRGSNGCLVVDVDGEHEGRELGVLRLIGEVAAARHELALGIERRVRRPGMQVAAGRGEAQPMRAHACGQSLRRVVG